MKILNLCKELLCHKAEVFAQGVIWGLLQAYWGRSRGTKCVDIGVPISQTASTSKYEIETKRFNRCDVSSCLPHLTPSQSWQSRLRPCVFGGSRKEFSFVDDWRNGGYAGLVWLLCAVDRAITTCWHEMRPFQPPDMKLRGDVSADTPFRDVSPSQRLRKSDT